ncbi:hypothetical protein AAMO2058_000761800 [Amorphochlora amoebiformis]
MARVLVATRLVASGTRYFAKYLSVKLTSIVRRRYMLTIPVALAGTGWYSAQAQEAVEATQTPSRNFAFEAHRCIQRGSLRQLKKLLQENQGRDFIDKFGRSPVMIAAMYHKVSMLRFLLTETDFGVNDVDTHGSSPLHYCFALRSSSQPAKVAVLLLSAGAKPLQEDDYGITPFHKAVAFGQHEIVRIMLKWGVDINTPTGSKHKASSTQDGKPLSESNSGDTALHIASRKGHEFMTAQLLELGADPTRVNIAGDSPLHDAVRMTHVGVTHTLINFGADPTIENKSALSATKMCNITDLQCARCLYQIYSKKSR